MAITGATDYARLAWSSSSAGYPSGLTLGNFGGGSADVPLVTGPNQPFYMLSFVDSTDSLGQAAAGDQILMIEFQSSTVSGANMPLDPNATLFNLYDNTAGFYLNGVHGQQVTKTLEGWLAADSFLSTDSLDQIRLGVGLGGGPGLGGSVTVSDFTGTQNLASATPEPATLALLGSGLFGLVFLRRRRVR